MEIFAAAAFGLLAVGLPLMQIIVPSKKTAHLFSICSLMACALAIVSLLYSLVGYVVTESWGDLQDIMVPTLASMTLAFIIITASLNTISLLILRKQR